MIRSYRLAGTGTMDRLPDTRESVPLMLTAQDIARLVKRSAATVSRWARKGEAGFPKPIQIAAHSQLWLASEFNAWIAQQVQKRDGSVVLPPRRRRRRAS